MFEFLFVIGIVLAFYGYSVMKNPHVWGDQGRDEIRPENWNGYVVHNGQFMMYSGFFLAALAALDVIFTFASWLYCRFCWAVWRCCSIPWPTGCTKKRANGGPGRNIKRRNEFVGAGYARPATLPETTVYRYLQCKAKRLCRFNPHRRFALDQKFTPSFPSKSLPHPLW